MELLRVPVMLPGSFGAWKALTVIALGVLAGLGKLFDLRDTISVLPPPLAAPLRRPAEPPAAEKGVVYLTLNCLRSGTHAKVGRSRV